MNDQNLYARCPTCRTVFRTDDWTLQLQVGKVRCGQCRMVFDGRANLVDVAFDDAGPDELQVVPPPRRQPEPSAPEPSRDQPIEPSYADAYVEAKSTDAPAADPKTDADADHETIEIPPVAEPVTDDAPGFAADTPASPAVTARTPYPQIGHDPLGMETMPAARGPDTASGPATRSRFPDSVSGPATRSRFAAAPDPSLRHDSVVMPEWTGPTAPPRGRARWVYGFFAMVLLGTLAAQALFHFRNVIAADYPVTRHHLIAACTMLGCRIEPLRNREEIAIESHDLQADPAHQGLLILQTTLRNQSRHPLAFPHLELELDDNAGKAIVRRVFTPIEYAGGAADFAIGIPANAEWNVKLFLDASSVPAGAYHLYHFYP